MKALTYRQRVGLLALLCASGFVLLVSRLVTLQVVDHDQWVAQADRLRSGWRPVRPRRGAILDADGEVLGHDASGFELAVLALPWRGKRHLCDFCGRVYHQPMQRCTRCRKKTAKVKSADRRNLGPIAALLKIPVPELRARIKKRVARVRATIEKKLKGLTGRKRKLQEAELWFDYGRRPLRLQREVPYAVAREVALHPDRNPAFVIQTSHSRAYPGGKAFVHILGRVRDAEPIEMKRLDGTTRRLTMQEGEQGLEYGLDDRLSGRPGWVELERDPMQSSRKILDEHRPQPGRDVRLTIRREDQVRGLNALHGLRDAEGAFVVVNAETGAVLTLATAPTYEPEHYVSTLTDWAARTKRAKKLDLPRPVGSPIIDRAFRSYAVPGSIMKPFTALAALRSGDGHFPEVIVCEREFRYKGIRANGILKCNKLHLGLDMHGALKISCNVYFQTLVARMLDERTFPQFVATGKSFGFGASTGIEIESANYRGRWRFDDAKYKGTLIAAAIGQGTVVVSPAQIARAYAGLATGHLPELHLVAGRSVTRHALPFDRRWLDQVRGALLQVPRAGGSAPDSGLDRWGMACKTGTAQRSKSRASRDTKPRYNAWMAGFAPAQSGRPPIAFAMVVLRSHHGGAKTCGRRLAEFFRYFYGGPA